MSKVEKVMVNIRMLRNELRGIRTYCPDCQKQLHETKFSVVLILDGKKYIFLNETRAHCCGSEVTIPLGFDDEESARAAIEEITQTVERERSLRSYEFQLLPDASDPTKH